MTQIIFQKVLRYLKSSKPAIIVKAPARINLINPLDAVEADYWAPAVTVNAEENPLSAFCAIAKDIEGPSRLLVSHLDEQTGEIVEDVSNEFDFSRLLENAPFWTRSDLDIFFGTMHYLFSAIPEFATVLAAQQLRVTVLTTIPRQSGIAGSSAIIIALIYAFGCLCGFTPDQTEPSKFSRLPFNRDIVGELATKIENEILGNTAGFGDRVHIARGGLGFASYVGKLNHLPIGSEPLTVYDRIDKIYNITELPIILAYSGVSHRSGNIHAVLRRKYLEGDPILHNLYRDLATIAWKVRFALMKKDWPALGKYFQENHIISEKVMQRAGFTQGIGWANKILIEILHDHPHVYAVKLSGAGGGGSVFALVDPNHKSEVLDFWKRGLKELLYSPQPVLARYPELGEGEVSALRNAQFYSIIIDPNGVDRVG